jgi:RHS repeat-associated protein
VHYTGSVNETVYYFGDFVRVVNASGVFDTIEYYHGDKLVAERKNDSTYQFYHPDSLGSTSLITNSSGGVVENTIYEPFGEVYSGASSSRFDYTGKETDDTGLQYFGARFYNPGIGKWTQADTYIENVYNPQKLNRYSFVLNNPYKYTDPDGHDGGFIEVGVTMAFPLEVLIGVAVVSIFVYATNSEVRTTVNNGVSKTYDYIYATASDKIIPAIQETIKEAQKIENLKTYKDTAEMLYNCATKLDCSIDPSVDVPLAPSTPSWLGFFTTLGKIKGAINGDKTTEKSELPGTATPTAKNPSEQANVAIQPPQENERKPSYVALPPGPSSGSRSDPYRITNEGKYIIHTDPKTGKSERWDIKPKN